MTPEPAEPAVEEPVHLRHSIDGYPLCWPMDRDGDFDGTYDEQAITCSECQAYLHE